MTKTYDQQFGSTITATVTDYRAEFDPTVQGGIRIYAIDGSCECGGERVPGWCAHLRVLVKRAVRRDAREPYRQHQLPLGI